MRYTYIQAKFPYAFSIMKRQRIQKRAIIVKIFIAADSIQIHRSLKATLDDIKGVEVIGESGDVGIIADRVFQLRPHVVMMDIRMPGGGGIDVLKEIKSRDPSIIVIMFTSYAYDLYEKKCLALGADFFLENAGDLPRIEYIIKSVESRIRPHCLDN